MNNLRNFPPVTLGIFQSTLLQEERRPYVMIYDKYKLFQSTLLQEERRDAGYRFRKPYGNFNPRSYKRSDVYKNDRDTCGSNFNPRSYKRSDQKPHYVSHKCCQFQSTLLQEERRTFLTLIMSTFFNFNPRSYKRSDASSIANLSDGNMISIHAPTRGATSSLLSNS